MKQSLTPSIKLPLAMAGCGMALLAATAPASAADPSIVVGSHNLLPNTHHQPIAIRVAGVSSVGMLNFNAQIAAGTGTSYPVFDGVDLTTGTIFAPDHIDPLDTGSVPRLATWSIVTASGTISSAEGLLATLYVDTTGVSSGTYSLSLGDTLNGPAVFYDATGLTKIPIPITDGSFTIVPEPASTALFLLTAPALLLRRKR